MPQPYGIGVIGCGMIAELYLTNAQEYHQDDLRPVACFDLDPERAARLAKLFGMQAVPTLEALLARDDVEIVLNLTNPPGHAPGTMAAIVAGKHVYSEKPVALTPDDADRIVAAAEQRGVEVACAPAIMLGSAHQTMWALIRAGKIGRVYAAAGGILEVGPETYHPNAHAFYGPGAGPLQDNGVYQVTMLTTMFGPVSEVRGMTQRAIPERVRQAGPHKGESFTIVEADQVTSLLQFENGVQATLIAGFSIASSKLPPFELYGDGGTLDLGEIWNFAAKVEISKRDMVWEEQPLLKPDIQGVDWARGVAEFAQALRENRPPRCTLQQARHVLEVMQGVLESGRTHQAVQITSRFTPPPPLPGYQID